MMLSHCCAILLWTSPVAGLTSIRPSPAPGWRASKIKSPRQNSSSSSELSATISFSGDASCKLVMENASVESVSEFLQSPDSDIYLLGTSNAELAEGHEERTKRDKSKNKRNSQLWECRQPVVDFIGLKLQPVFVYKVLRIAPGHVQVSIVDARTNILEASRNPAKQAIKSMLESSTFEGESVFTVHPPDAPRDDSTTSKKKMTENCVLSMELRLTLLISLPPFMPLPPGFNSLGGAIVRRTGKARTKQLLDQLQEAYRQHCEQKAIPEMSRKSVSD